LAFSVTRDAAKASQASAAVSIFCDEQGMTKRESMLILLAIEEMIDLHARENTYIWDSHLLSFFHATFTTSAIRITIVVIHAASNTMLKKLTIGIAIERSSMFHPLLCPNCAGH
jgi:hypothetical protein